MYKGRCNVKLKTFYDREEYGLTHNGASFVTKHYASDEVEKFINKPQIDVVDIKSFNDCICVIYTEVR